MGDIHPPPSAEKQKKTKIRKTFFVAYRKEQILKINNRIFTLLAPRDFLVIKFNNKFTMHKSSNLESWLRTGHVVLLWSGGSWIGYLELVALRAMSVGHAKSVAGFVTENLAFIT